MCALAILAASAPRAARAQFAFTDRAAFVDFAINKSLALPLCFNNLNGFADGTTTIPFGVASTPFVPCGTATLVGASIMNGQIESATPFTMLFPKGTWVIGADFSAAGDDVAYISLFQGQTLVGTVTRAISGTSGQFLGAVVFGWKPDRFEFGTQNGAAFAVDNLYTAAPEPSAVLLVATGLLALGAARAAHRRSPRA